MSFPIILLVMLAAGLLGGLINFLLPANENAATGKKIKPWEQCLILGIGATLLVPLFLEIAQSKLLDDIYYEFSWQNPKYSANTTNTASAVLRTPTPISAKNYLLYLAYCLVAAASGFKFINMLINNVVKDQQISKQKEKISELQKDKEKRVRNGQISQKKEEKEVRSEITRTAILPELPPIIHPDDPQKGRFGGRQEHNNRQLKATVSESFLPEFYNVAIWVETTDPKMPLNADVVFYLHDSFNPSIYLIKPNEFTPDGKAMDDTILSYGAFTVGVITDNGKTLLELDLAEDKKFPKEFRVR